MPNARKLKSNDKAGEEETFRNLGDFHKTIEYHGRSLEVAKEVSDKGGEEQAYGNLGIAYENLSDFH